MFNTSVRLHLLYISLSNSIERLIQVIRVSFIGMTSLPACAKAGDTMIHATWGSYLMQRERLVKVSED